MCAMIRKVRTIRVHISKQRLIVYKELLPAASTTHIHHIEGEVIVDVLAIQTLVSRRPLPKIEGSHGMIVRLPRLCLLGLEES